MPVQLVEDGQEKIVSELTAFRRLPDGADLGAIASRLLRDDRIHTMNRAGAPIQLQLVRVWHKDQPFEPEAVRRQPELFVTETVPPPPPGQHTWVGDCTVLVELDVTVHCQATDEQAAERQIEETILGHVTARPDFQIEVSNDAVTALMDRIDAMRLPTDLAPAHVTVHKVMQTRMLEDQTS